MVVTAHKPTSGPRRSKFVLGNPGTIARLTTATTQARSAIRLVDTNLRGRRSDFFWIVRFGNAVMGTYEFKYPYLGLVLYHGGTSIGVDH
jgi:hypothetical protein